jgi:hypothetical protein
MRQSSRKSEMAAVPGGTGISFCIIAERVELRSLRIEQLADERAFTLTAFLSERQSRMSRNRGGT